MRREIRILAWYLLLLAVLRILKCCQNLEDLARFGVGNQSVLNKELDIKLRLPPCYSAFRYFVHQVNVATLSAAIRDWRMA